MRRPAAAVVLFTALAFISEASAAQRQPAPAAPEAPAATNVAQPVAVAPAMDARQVKDDLDRLLDQYPPTVGRVLRLDPTLLSDENYLKPYPSLAAFLAQHPEIAHNPAFYFSNYNEGGFYRDDPKARIFNLWTEVMQGFFIAAVFAAIAGALAWLIKTVIEHRRWTRMSKIQTEVHYKLLDRFNSNEDLLAYMQTPAGRRFFEAGPMPVVEAPRSLNAPLSRILWSAQVGAVLTLAGLGLEVVATRSIEEISQPLSAIGIVVLALGIGFGVSAAMAYVLSKRLGLISGEVAAPGTRG
jgi:hypothetical protein